MKKFTPHFLLSKLGSNGIVIIVLAVLLLIFWHIAMRGLRGGREITLVECTNTVTTTDFKTEMGQGFLILFKTKTNSPSTYPVHVHLINVTTKQVDDFAIDHYADFYPFNTGRFLRPDSYYEMVVTFPKQAQPAMVISLQWTQRLRDRGK